MKKTTNATTKKAISKKLALSKTTLRSLSTAEFDGVVGGATFKTCSALCSPSDLTAC